ncbi:hypothetical protein [Dysgonomonas massiliensis]|uniref:hypothetical protein n=1 Tax=Dysgonomonas massiliensis TaxID=2040292 RepID=UPI000C7587E1|nr:hypothetical protein [Dysgonomonas massiliensis]
MKFFTKLTFICLLVALNTFFLQAQVTIGSGTKPNKGALLDLKENDALGANSKKGLLLPRVNLKSLTITNNSNDLKSTIDKASGIDVWNPIDHSGLTVYNLTDAGELCPGIYVWNENIWMRIQGPCPDRCAVPAITTHPTSAAICPGTTRTLTVATSGTSPLTYQWQKDDVNIAGATTASYGATTAGSYRCVVTNTCGTATSNVATITLNAVPAITTHPTSAAICPGTTRPLAVAASGTSPLTYQWQKDDVNIAGATTASYGATTAGSYRCVVTNTCGTATSNVATITLNAVPAITTHPTSAAICPGTTRTLTVAASGTSPLTYQWQKDGVNIAGATAASYGATAAGSYKCIVTNTCGTATSNVATITLNAVPAITTHPVGGEICPGGTTLGLKIAASGTSPLTYQWQKDGANIAGATTSTYTATTGGSYRCVVSNTCGTATSNLATVTENCGTFEITNLKAKYVMDGQSYSFTMNASRDWKATINKGAAITDITNTTTGVAGQFTYTFKMAIKEDADATATITFEHKSGGGTKKVVTINGEKLYLMVPGTFKATVDGWIGANTSQTKETLAISSNSTLPISCTSLPWAVVEKNATSGAHTMYVDFNNEKVARSGVISVTNGATTKQFSVQQEALIFDLKYKNFYFYYTYSDDLDPIVTTNSKRVITHRPDAGITMIRPVSSNPSANQKYIAVYANSGSTVRKATSQYGLYGKTANGTSVFAPLQQVNVTQYGGPAQNAAYVVNNGVTEGPLAASIYAESSKGGKIRVYIKPTGGLKFVKAAFGTITGSSNGKVTLDAQGTLADGSYYADLTVTPGTVTGLGDHVFPLVFTMQQIPYDLSPSTPSTYTFTIRITRG